MTVENLEANGNQSPEEHKEEKAVETKGKETLALSVQQRPLLPNNRPIEPSHLDVVSTYSAVGGTRPVTKNTMDISRTMTVSGSRPIGVSTLNVSDTYIMGNRPIASNEIDDFATLVGYLD